MDLLTLLRVLLGLAMFATVYFLLAWIAERRRLNNLTYIEARNLQISEEIARQRRRNVDVVRDRLARLGYHGDAAPLLVGVAFLYLVIAAAATMAGASEPVALLLAFPGAVAATVSILGTVDRRRRLAATGQMLQLIRNAVTHLEAGNTPQQAFSKAAIMLGNPLRQDVLAALAAQVGPSGMGAVMAPLRAKYDGPATRLLVSALEVNDLVGARLAPTLRQAEEILRRQLELAAEANAEISQARAEFIGISAIIGLIAASLVIGAGEAARDAYTSIPGITLILLGVGNYAVGVWRTLRVFRRAKGGLQ